jgi:NADPH2:quinone reductase
MKAVVYEKFGPPEVLELREVEKPVPGDREVLIRVRATTVNAADCNGRGFSYIPTGLGFLARLMLGIRKPKISILGSALAGEIETVGKDVKSFKPGDPVFGSGPELGAYAEYARRSETGALAIKPVNITYEQAATVPYGALTALYFLRDKGEIKSGQKVLVNGASGGVGVFAVQLARYFGAQVTGVCSTPNMEWVKSLGAEKVIDYTKEDFTQTGEKWDLIFDVVVGKTSFSRCKNSLTKKGVYLAVAGGLNDMLQMVWTSVKGGRKVVFGGGEACERKENLLFLKELIETEKIKPVMDRSFPLDEIVEAHRYVELGHKKGNIAVTVP